MAQPSTQRNYDLLATEALIDPYPLYEQIRTEEPVYYYEKGGFWLLTRYQDVEAAFLDSRLSADHQTLFFKQLQGLDLKSIQNFLKFTSNFIAEKDPPVHTMLKDIALPRFAPDILNSWRSLIQDVTDELFDAVESQHSMDVVADLAVKLPSIVITRIFGFPEVDRQKFVEWGLGIADFWGFSSNTENIQEVASRADQSAANFIDLIAQVISSRQQTKADDILSQLIAGFDEQAIDFQYLPALCVAIIGGDHLITSDAISNSVYALLNNPQKWQELKENPELLDSALEELIRFDPPINIMFRLAKENLVIGDKEIKAGDIVALSIGAANRDPEKFSNPNSLDFHRSNNEHLSFGKGAHSCTGTALARMELKITFSTLIRRIQNLEFDPTKTPIVKRSNLVFKGFSSLPVKF